MTDQLDIDESLIDYKYHGQRVDIVLAQHFPQFSRSQLTQWLKEGIITLNNRIYKPKEKVLGGERIDFKYSPRQAVEVDQAEDIALDIIFEDDYVLVINKPAGLVVHPGAGNKQHTLLNALLYHHPALQELPRAGLIHRLDKDTTGLLVIAKTLAAYTHLIREMQARAIERRYYALVYGHLIGGGRIETGYGRHPRNRLKMAVCKQGREAVTLYNVYKQYGYCTLLDVALMTGRTHQIRVHLSHINHSLIGDPLYGGRIRFPAGSTPELRTILHAFKRQALHAYSLAFMHPTTGQLLTCSASLPDDLQSLLNELDNYFDSFDR
ncbi:MAG: 23S rRNA pseudouridine(1911/1915/1917) synthase RluD [Legionella sp.]